MRSRRPELIELLTNSEVLRRPQLGDLDPTARAAVRRGELVTMLPGTYVSRRRCQEPSVRLQALMAYCPQAVITGPAAAALHLGRPMPATISASAPIALRRPGFEIRRRHIESEWVIESHGLRVTAPELTALDLIPDHGADMLDELLRRAGTGGQRVLDRCWEAHRAHPQRPGNHLRGAILNESRDLPWSQAERRAHTLLRRARITGWKTNHEISWRGERMFADIAFPAKRVVVEIDGFQHHCDRAQFERDRWRWNLLSEAGWDVRIYTWTTLQNPATFITAVRRLLR